MQIPRTRARIFVTALATVAGLTAGLTTPVSAPPGAEPTHRSAKGPKASDAGPLRTVPLLTGDRAVVDEKGALVSVERGEGRERIAFESHERDGHTYVIPADARRLIDSGSLDRRLFDITERAKAAYRSAHGTGLKVIVRYGDGARSRDAARSQVRAADGTRLARSLATLGADALTVSRDGAADLWNALTDPRGSGGRAAAPGIDRVWLDAVTKASLDKSVPRVGAPAAWQSGYDGTGVKIAVLDTGVDATHPDLAGRVVAEHNLTDTPDTKDRHGHGTHVASTAAGSGARSGGTHKGVAPGASVLNGKVLDDGGSGLLSWVAAGMDWAAAQGADIVNLSLSADDTPELDVMEVQVNTLARTKGVLFAVAAGNAGRGWLGSPATAEEALAVGAVDAADKVADFSGSGPGVGTELVKPELTAPGVDIKAAASSLTNGGADPSGYTAMSGTSMAAPHVAGAAALLKQRHRNWTQRELKGALIASAKDTGDPTLVQGTGRLQVDRALTQTVFTDPVSLGFGTAQWPHHDDVPRTKEITYRNTGSRDVVLDLSVTGEDQQGRPAPQGFFALGSPRVTVPAGGSVSVGLAADTRLGGDVDGHYTAEVVATGGGQSVRSVATVHREVESYDLTIETLGRDGLPTREHATTLNALSGPAKGQQYRPHDPSGTVRLRVPAADYSLVNPVYVALNDVSKGMDLIVQPRLRLTGDTKVTVDARTARPVDITVPDAGAAPVNASPSLRVDSGQVVRNFVWALPSYRVLRTAHLGEQVPDGWLSQQWGGQWVTGRGEEYNTVHRTPVNAYATGYAKQYRPSELATLRAKLGASVAGKQGALFLWPLVQGGTKTPTVRVPQPVPGVRTVHVSATPAVSWDMEYRQNSGVVDEWGPVPEVWQSLPAAETYLPGRTYRKAFNTGVLGPRLGDHFGLYREGNEVYGMVPLFSDARRNLGRSDLASVRTTLHRGDVLVGENDDALFGWKSFRVPADEAEYRLSTSVTRAATVATNASRVDASWTFRSAAGPAGATRLPASVAWFDASVAPDGTVPAGRVQVFPVRVEGTAAGTAVRSLTVQASYDGGASWDEQGVRNGKVSVRNPAAGRDVSLRARLVDRDGNVSTVTVHDAYRGR
ncbi:S8 family serine peptidase [Streptomyces sp. NPDC059578]|uniref:S8 family peptidase n=1 Tax=Streptomyces sp. NPDC059578 TaxID=3346874 RepID=UPI0036AD7293